MKPKMRNYQTEEDYWCIRQFLRQVSLLNDRRDFAWSLLRWDYWRWHVNKNIFQFHLHDVVTLWEADGQLIAMLNPDSPGEAFFQIHPAYCGLISMEEMLDMAESKLSRCREDGQRELIVWVNAGDLSTQRLFTKHGYVRSKFQAEHMRRRPLTQPVSDAVFSEDTPSA